MALFLVHHPVNKNFSLSAVQWCKCILLNEQASIDVAVFVTASSQLASLIPQSVKLNRTAIKETFRLTQHAARRNTEYRSPPILSTLYRVSAILIS